MNTHTLETPSTTATPQPAEAPITPATTTNEVNPTSVAPAASETDIDQAAIASIRKNLAAMPSTSTEEVNSNPNIRHEISPTLPSATETSVVNTEKSKPKTGLKALILGLFSKKQTPLTAPTPENITSFEAKKDQIQNPNLPASVPSDSTIEKAA